VTRFLGCLACAMLAWFVGAGLHVPVWNAGWALAAMGDRCDMASTAFCAAIWLSAERRSK